MLIKDNSEQVDISCTFKIDRDNKKLLQEALKLFSSPQLVSKDDTVHLHYDFTITYFDNVKEKLEMMCKLWDKADRKSLSFKTLTRTKLLSYTVFKLCDKLLKHIEK